MKPYRAPPSRAPSPGEPSLPDYARFARFEQLCIYAFMAIALVLLAIAEIKIP